jgi:PPE-repeat protein
MAMDYAALPPEINSGRMYTGPGSGPMLAAAAAWDGLATELSSAAANYSSVMSELTDEGWLGPSSASMAAAAAPHVEWLTTTASQAEQTAAQAKSAATAYEAAFAATVAPQVIAANRASLSALVTTNVFGQNTPAIAATEAHYGEMWAQDTAAMYGYAGASATASRITPFTAPQQTTNPGGTASQAAAVAHALATSPASHTPAMLSNAQQSMSAVPNALQGLTTPSTSSTTSGLSGILEDIMNYTPPGIVQTLEQASGATISPGLVSSAWATGAISWGLGAAQAGAAHAAATTAVPSAGYTMVNAVAPSSGGAAVSASMGESALLADSLSVPKGWATAAPASLVAAAVPSTNLSAVAAPASQGLFSGMPLFGGAPLMTLPGRSTSSTDSRNRQKPQNDDGTPPASA